MANLSARRVLACLAAAACCLVAVAARAQGTSTARGNAPTDDGLKTLLAQAAAYIDTFEKAFSNVVSEERYEQQTYPRPGRYVGGPGPRIRELVSDFLLVQFPDPDGWVPFRDVFEVDKRPVRDRQNRLVQLFTASGVNAGQQAKELTEESARYNIGIIRTVNHPLMAFHALRAWQQHRFRFWNLKPEPSLGPTASVLEFAEQKLPSIIRGTLNRDMPMHGHLWIDRDTGRILKTEVLVDDPYISASIVTRFQYDATLGAALPVEMREEYRHPNGDRSTGVATYGRFRRFGVEVVDTIADK